MSTNHSLTTVNILGINVSFAPLNAPTITVDAANNGSDKSSILNIFTPNSLTATSGVNKPKTSGTKKYKATAVIVTIITPHLTADQANFRARSFHFAPRACPTSVVAAIDIPNAGR